MPGQWAGDLIIDKRNASAIGTLIERTTGYMLLVPVESTLTGTRTTGRA